jgi:hypothetical protein
LETHGPYASSTSLSYLRGWLDSPELDLLKKFVTAGLAHHKAHSEESLKQFRRDMAGKERKKFGV